MKRLFPLIPLLALLAMLPGCVKNQVKIVFRLEGDTNTPCRVTYYASNRKGGMMRETVAEITAGKGEIVLPQVRPAIIYLFSPSSTRPEALIYGARGEEFTVTGPGNDVALWHISGNSTTEALSEWRLENADLLKRRDAKGINRAVADYVKKHPDSKAAAIILYVYFERRGNEKEFENLEAVIDEDVRDDGELTGALSMADLFTGLPVKPTVPSRIIMTGVEGYADTLNLKDGRDHLLMFLKANDTSAALSADTLKALAARKGKGSVAELYLDSDSLGWRRHLRDTVPGMHRMWMPMGLADSVAISMGVRRLPYYIVVDSKGKEVYSGDDRSAALGKFNSP